MATLNGAANLTTYGTLAVNESALQNISTPIAAVPTAEVDFVWGPQGLPFSYVIGGTVFVAENNFITSINEELTFTAETTFPEGKYPISFHWNFGDGVEAWGVEVTHEFEIPNESLRVVLTVTDNEGDRINVSHPMYLQDLDPAIVNPYVIVLTP